MTEHDFIRERVEELGGITDAPLRFSIEWNDGILLDNNDLDAWCIEPSGHKINYSCKNSPHSCGFLDIDVTSPANYYKSAVENITYKNKNRMPYGKYQFIVYNFESRGGTGGFRAEIILDGERHEFDYTNKLENKEKVYVATVTYNRNGTFTIEKHI